ncbi:hypothetical protein E4U42_004261 [Claviceps africana]|uniref:Cell wall proline rich protein n=1 Tax=Claviceps africana TaxID=83212 RepID=A0A8K0J5X9_9HYPO|nr:hypothetical protein E4U42_004261 [Claviceps africana]
MATAHDIRCSADVVASHPPAFVLECDTRTPTFSQPNACAAEPGLPNPTFALSSFPSATVTPSTRTRRRPMSMADIQQSCSLNASPVSDPGGGSASRIVALPQFSFNPGASIPSTPDSAATLRTPISPNTARLLPSPSRPAGHGHRRGGSEFVGGSIRDGNSIAVGAMSTSPTKSDSGLTSSCLQLPPPHRGHRRGLSGAIPVNDLPFLYPKPDFLSQKGNSAPNSPTTFSLHDSTLLPLDQPCPLPLPLATTPAKGLNDTGGNAVVNHSVSVSNSPLREGSSPEQIKSAGARVGFSDTLEFIPRPLSLVSSDASSTLTARLGHTVSGSISSIMSAAPPGDRDGPAKLTRSPTHETVEPRPSTAGAILERTATDFRATAPRNTLARRRNSVNTLLDNVAAESSKTSNPSPAKAIKRWSFFGMDPFLGSTSSSRQQQQQQQQQPLCSINSSESMNKPAVGGDSLSDHDSDLSGDDQAAVNDTNESKKERKKSSRKTRVKGWAGAILPLRSNRKQSKMLAVRPPTPPASVGVLEDDEDEKETDLMQDASESETSFATPTVLVTESHPAETVSAPPNRRPDEDGTCPMIDLDAALGPFNTPLPRNAEWDAAQRAAGLGGKRKLYSAQVMKGFSGPGMHYHRRAESAPDLPPFESGRTGVHKFGSSSTMADVFEEDEEDDVEAQSTQPNAESRVPEGEDKRDDDADGEASSTLMTGTTPVVASVVNEVVGSDWPFKAADATSPETAPAIRRVCSGRSKSSPHPLQEEVHAEEPRRIILRNTSVFGGLPTDQPNSASSSPRLSAYHRDASAVDVIPSFSLTNATVAPLSPYSTSQASSYNSPRSPMSIDVQRISTAPSSMTDGNSFHSLLMGGEPGPELRISVDYDISSITSSTSTTTRESAFIPTARMSQPSLRAQRPVSVSSAAFGRRRSSLVSLSRLISSAHGERSKLSMEVTMDNEGDARKSRSKDSKTKRLGRMMQFWKPSKDGGPA